MMGGSNILDRGGLDAPRRTEDNLDMIKETVDKIEAAIRELESTNPKNKAELIALLEKLKAEVKSDRRKKDVLDEAEESLHTAALEFEAEHPKLAAVVNEVTTLLASIGI
jgi:septal ring factor EnvC (AmiA/AmiB activator)